MALSSYSERESKCVGWPVSGGDIAICFHRIAGHDGAGGDELFAAWIACGAAVFEQAQRSEYHGG